MAWAPGSISQTKSPCQMLGLAEVEILWNQLSRASPQHGGPLFCPVLKSGRLLRDGSAGPTQP
jgi:hypothetical protein